MEDPSEFLQSLLRLPDDQIIPPDADLSPFYRTWGFTVFRTSYKDGSDQHWQSLLDKIASQVSIVVLGSDSSRQGNPVAQQIMSLFRLDARSKFELLNNLEMDQVRQLYKDGVGGQPMNSDERSRRCFLLADDEVLEGVSYNESWVKCVDVDYIAADHIPRNTRLGGQRYFGWMKMATQSVSQLWDMLGSRHLVGIAPPTIGGSHLTVWESDAGI
ncbi:hypothetical protein EJ04DRAFT_367798 [Polyplosphaeria fusca]|uniref:Uncharacterized protein n=1 Tax=Polyplosphaeria fusca TaxID=682080 RepID=A0A9P4V0P6_9PLEO|nr:hypothetical protein EJ04DRAFT_367798 [Polyplosphaeria fusca]